MKEYVLFSPIGLTDPTKSEYDGPFLHILRHYKPTKVYIFLTKETKAFDDGDNRYEIMAKKLLPSCEVVKLDYSHIEKANSFLTFDEPFEREIKKIKADNPDCEILVNITSGTAQMEATLYLLSAVLPFPVTAIQVSTWQNSSNRDSNRPVYNIEAEWGNLMDNESDESIKSRCIPVIPENVRKRIIIENMISLISNYDYFGALRIMESSKDLFSQEFIHFLEAAAYRIALNIKKAEQELRLANIPKGDIFCIETSGVCEVFEYILCLQIKAKRNELADFSRGISPVLTDLFEDYLEKGLNKHVALWCVEKRGVKKLIIEKLPDNLKEYMNSKYQFGFNDSPVAASNLLEIITFYNSGNRNSEVMKIAKNLRDFEENVRNIASHEIVGITEEFLKAKTNMTSEQVLKALYKMFDFAFKTSKKDMWDSYEKMNEKLIGYLK